MKIFNSVSRLAHIGCAAIAIACIATPAFAAPPVPEIGLDTAGSAITLLLGSLAMLERYRA